MSNSMLIAMRNALKVLIESGKFDRVLDKVNIISAGNGSIRAEMLVTKECANMSGKLHGGMTATIVDQISSLALSTALISEPINGEFVRIESVSVDLSVSYMSPVKVGQTILIEANTLKYGRSMAFLNVDILNKETLKLVANGRHTKYILNKPSL